MARGKHEELQGLHNNSEIAPPAKEVRHKKQQLASVSHAQTETLLDAGWCVAHTQG